MQQVEGSSPFSRLRRPAFAGLLGCQGTRTGSSARRPGPPVGELPRRREEDPGNGKTPVAPRQLSRERDCVRCVIGFGAALATAKWATTVRERGRPWLRTTATSSRLRPEQFKHLPCDRVLAIAQLQAALVEHAILTCTFGLGRVAAVPTDAIVTLLDVTLYVPARERASST